MLSYIEFKSSFTHVRTPIVHSTPYLEYVFVSRSGRNHDMRCMYRVVVRFYNLL
jgi:hypothetical protein